MQTTTSRVHAPERAREYFENKLAFTTGPVELAQWIKSGEDNLIVVDVRSAADFAQGHIPGAINLPADQWGNPRGLSRDKTNVIYCYTQQCHLAANACVRFAASGFPVMELEGGFAAWVATDQDIEPGPTNRLKGQPLERMVSRK